MKKFFSSIFLVIIGLICIMLFASCEAEIKGVAVIFDCMGGQFESGESATTINFEENITLPDAPEKEGYTFENWYIDTNYQNELNLEGDYEGTLKVYAKWGANNNSLVFDSNGGEGEMEDMTIPSNQTATLIPNEFTRDNYTFAGWAETENGKVVYGDES